MRAAPWLADNTFTTADNEAFEFPVVAFNDVIKSLNNWVSPAESSRDETALFTSKAPPLDTVYVNTPSFTTKLFASNEAIVAKSLSKVTSILPLFTPIELYTGA